MKWTNIFCASASAGEPGRNRSFPAKARWWPAWRRRKKFQIHWRRVTAVKFGRYRRPFDAGREADWIASAVDLNKVGVILSGAKGFRQLNPFYEAVVAALTERAGKEIEHQTYRQFCGEFHSASAFGFSVAVKLAREKKCGVLLLTLSLRGAKAICLVEP